MRDGGVLAADDAAAARTPRRSKLTAEQSEIARLKKELTQANSKLETTQTALDIMGKAHALLEQISKSADSPEASREALMIAYEQLTCATVAQRRAAELTGMSRSTMDRRASKSAAQAAGTAARRDRRSGAEPANKLDEGERAAVLAALNSDRFVDDPPTQVYAALLAEGCYLCSISTMYRVLNENKQVAERRRLAKHAAKSIPELVATAPRQVYTWDITKLAGPRRVFRRLRDDRHLLPLHRRRARSEHRIRAARGGDDA